MARTTELEIYRPAYQLLELLAKLTGQYPRNYRQVVGREVFAESQTVVVRIFRANSAGPDTRPSVIEDLREHLETLRLLLRLSKDLNLISPASYGAIFGDFYGK